MAANGQGRELVPWLLDATDASQLQANARLLLEHLSFNDGATDMEIAGALVHREPLGNARAVILGASRQELVRGLQNLAVNNPSESVISGTRRERVKTAVIFGGLGAGLHCSGKQLYAHSDVFATAFDQVADELERHLVRGMRDVLWGDDDRWSDRTVWEHAALFAHHVAQYRLFVAVGVVPDHLVGHSLGETAAAYFAGVFSLADACRLIVERARMVEKIPQRGAMMAVEASIEEIEQLLDRGADVAAVNGPRSFVIAGPFHALQEVETAAILAGRRAKRLRTSHAFHSRLMDHIHTDLTALVRSMPLTDPTRSLVSSVTGGSVTGAELCEPAYWTRNARGVVRFSDSIHRLQELGVTTVVELGVGGLLCPMVALNSPDMLCVPLLGAADVEYRSVLSTLARLHVSGADVRWDSVIPGLAPGAVAIPDLPIPPSRAVRDGSSTNVQLSAQSVEDVPILGRVIAHVRSVLGDRRNVNANPDTLFGDLGITSLDAVELCNRIRADTGLPLPISAIFDYPSARALSTHLGCAVADDRDTPGKPPSAGSNSAPREDDPVVIVGMAGRFPGGVGSPEELWTVLRDGVDAIGNFPTDRGWDLEHLYDPTHRRPGTSVTDQGGFLDDVALFDAEFFGVSAREALLMDPQQRLALESAWTALEDAGINPRTLAGQAVGVFVGVYPSGYRDTASRGGIDAFGRVMLGAAGSVVSGRIAYTLGLEGPAVSIDTACSSSLVALHNAAQSLRNGECTLALAGGVTVMSEPDLFVAFSELGGLSPDGRCRAFDDDANGTGWAEAVGMLVLERLSTARSRNHRVLAVLAGSAINHDGASNGLTAPRAAAQQQVIQSALADARVGPADVDVVEAHGTGTKLGDPIEAEAIFTTYGAGRSKDNPIYLGSLKSNVGHTQAAAGVGGVIKMVLAMRHELLPRSLHLNTPNSHVDWQRGGVSLLRDTTPWPRTERPRRAGVSAFGISGSNAHVILQEPPPIAPDPNYGVSGRLPLLLSAADPDVLKDQARLLAMRLSESAAPRDGDVAYTLLRGRARMEYGAIVIASNRTAAVEALHAVAEGRRHADVVEGRAASCPTAMLFTGQGAQRIGMGEALAARHPIFGQTLNAVAAHCDPHLRQPLLDVMLGKDPNMLHCSEFAQPALFAFEVALARLAEFYGVRPDYVIGHSVGEVAAAHIAGVLSLPDACHLVSVRARLMQSLPAGGAMVALQGTEEELTPLLGPGADLAAVNTADSLVISGDEDTVDRIASKFKALGRRTRKLRTSHAFHSHRMDPILDEFRATLAAVTFHPPRIPFVSGMTGLLANEETLSASYFCNHIRRAVRFADGLATLRTHGVRRFVEIGPDATLSTFANSSDTVTVPLQRGGDRDDCGSFIEALARLQVSGVEIDWTADLPDTARLIELPTYPFKRRRYWPGPPTGTDIADVGGPLREPSNREWQYAIDWQTVDREGLSTSSSVEGPWLLLGQRRDVLRSALRRNGVRAIVPPAGDDVDEFAWLQSTLSGGVGAQDYSGVLWSPDADATGIFPRLLRMLVDSAPATRLWIATTGAVHVPGDSSPPRPDVAMLWAAGRIAALEHPTTFGGLLDLPVADSDIDAALLHAILTRSGEDQIALRGGSAFGRRLVPAAPAPHQTWRPSGTVMITGGTGGVGQQLAGWVADNGASHIVVLSRQGANSKGAEHIRSRVEAAGARLTMTATDVTDRHAVAELLQKLARQGEPVRSVFHLAGSVRSRALIDISGGQSTTDAKAEGARVLSELLTGSSLDALVFFSSVSGVWGAPALAEYAASNAYLDAFAADCRSLGLPANAIAWGPWDGVGMAGGEAGRNFARAGVQPMRPDVALGLLPQLVGSSAPTSSIVADLDRATFAALFNTVRPSPLLTYLYHRETTPPTPRPDARQQDWAAELRAMPADTRLTAASKLVISELADVVGVASTELSDGDDVWQRAGLDSLGAVELHRRLNRATGLPLSSTVAFDYPGVQALARHLIDRAMDAMSDEMTSVIDRLEEQLTGLSADGPVRAQIVARLTTLIGNLSATPAPNALDRTGQPPSSGLAQRLAVADDGELFALLDAQSTTTKRTDIHPPRIGI